MTDKHSAQSVPRCESVCVNMHKNCGGCCTKKRGHRSPHRCGWCRSTWDLSPGELASRLSPEKQQH